MNTLKEIVQTTLDEKLCRAFGIFRVYSREEMEGVLGIDPSSEMLDSLRSGYLAAQNEQKLNFWQIRDRGVNLRIKLGWTASNAEAWIKEQQDIYARGFDFYFTSQGQISPRETPLVEYVKMQK